MNVALFLDGDCYNDDQIFNLSSWINRDNGVIQWVKLQKFLAEKGIEIHTYDKYDISEIDKAVFTGLYNPNSQYLKKMQSLNKECYYIAIEPPVIHHYNSEHMLRMVSTEFTRIATYQDNLIDGDKFVPYREGKIYPNREGYVLLPFDKRKLCLEINSYRYANADFDEYPELYSERFRIAKVFEGLTDDFHLYGRGFNDRSKVERRWPNKEHIHFDCWKGEIEHKIGVMCKYRFNICFENCYGVNGYVSEKILDSFYARTIPIYWGCTNPTDYFPADTFIDMREFDSYEELYVYLNEMAENDFNTYIANIEKYLRSEQYEKYFGENVFSENFYNLIK